MSDLLMHDSRRLVLPLDTTVDALIEFDRAHKRWPERVTLDSARLGPSGVVVSVRQSGQGAPIERIYSLAIVAAAIIHYCAKMRVPVPKNASKSVSVSQDGITMVLEGTLFLQRQHDALPDRMIAGRQITENSQADERAGGQAEEASSPASSDPSPAAEPGVAALDAAAEGQETGNSAA
jgi:hypothetical protein